MYSFCSEITSATASLILFIDNGFCEDALNATGSDNLNCNVKYEYIGFITL